MTLCVYQSSSLSFFQTKLTELYKSASVDSESRVGELLSGVERLQSLLETLSQEKDQLQAQLDVQLTR